MKNSLVKFSFPNEHYSIYESGDPIPLLHHWTILVIQHTLQIQIETSIIINIDIVMWFLPIGYTRVVLGVLVMLLFDGFGVLGVGV